MELTVCGLEDLMKNDWRWRCTAMGFGDVGPFLVQATCKYSFNEAQMHSQFQLFMSTPFVITMLITSFFLKALVTISRTGRLVETGPFSNSGSAGYNSNRITQ